MWSTLYVCASWNHLLQLATWPGDVGALLIPRCATGGGDLTTRGISLGRTQTITQKLLALPREVFSPSTFFRTFQRSSFPPNPRSSRPFPPAVWNGREEYEFPLCTLAVAAWILPDLILELQSLQPPPGLSEFFFWKEHHSERNYIIGCFFRMNEKWGEIFEICM